MKLHKTLIITLLAAGSLIMGSAQAQEKLFTAKMGNILDKDATYSSSSVEVIPLGTPKQISGILVLTYQNATDYSDEFSPISYKQAIALKLFSVTGTELKDFSSVLSPGDDVTIRPFANGTVVVQVESFNENEYYNDYIFYSKVGADWVETKRFAVDEYDEAAIQDGNVFEDGNAPAGFLAFLKKEGEFVMVDIWTSNKAALTPAPDPKITSDLSDLVLKVGKPMPKYSTTTNFETESFLAFGLPPGVKFDTATGQIFGKPTEKGYYNVVIGASKRGAGAILATKNLRVK